MKEMISKLTLRHHELRHGSVANVPRHLTHAAASSLHRAIEASHQGRLPIAVANTPFEVFAELSHIADGNAAYYVGANRALGGGRVPTGTPLYIGTTAVRLCCAPTAWRYILRDYLAAAAFARSNVMFCAFGDMPKHLPFAAGYLTPDANRLNREEREMTVVIARLMAIRLANISEEASFAAEKAGRDFTPNPEEYPELL